MFPGNQIFQSITSPEQISEITDFLHIDANSHKLKVDKKCLSGNGQKWMWPVWSQDFNPLIANITKWSNTLKQFVGKLPTHCLSVFDHFVGLAIKGLKLAVSQE